MMERIWQVIFIVLAATALWFMGIASVRSYHYFHLTSSTTSFAVDWSFKELSEDHFVYVAEYSFKVKNQVYSGKDTQKTPFYRNAWAAEDALKKSSPQQITIWYSERSPQDSALEKNFPLKEWISSLLLWGLLIYFLYLKRYVSRFITNS